jgi:hypothetical protein
MYLTERGKGRSEGGREDDEEQDRRSKGERKAPLLARGDLFILISPNSDFCKIKIA